MGKWLAKTEPETYSIHDLKRDRRTEWDGVRNALAQQYLRQMEVGDAVLIYHTGKERAIMGLAEVTREKYLDPTDEKSKAVCVDFKFGRNFNRPVSLAEIKAHPKLRTMTLARVSRLSVMPVSDSHWKMILDLAEK